MGWALLIIATQWGGCSPDVSVFPEGKAAHTVRAFGNAVAGQEIAADGVPVPLTTKSFVAHRTFYVEESGADEGNAQCARSLPCRQVAHALELAAFGDLILVGAGHFEPFSISKRQPAHKALLVIRGKGDQTEFLAGPHGIRISDSSSVALENFAVTLPAAQKSGFGIHLQKAAGVSIRSVSVSGEFQECLSVERSSRVETVRNHFRGGEGTEVLLRFTDSTLARISDNLMIGGRTALSIAAREVAAVPEAWDPSAATEFRVDRNRLLKQRGDAVVAEGVRRLAFINNVLVGAKGVGVALKPANAAGGPAGSSVAVDAGLFFNTIVTSAESPAAVFLDLGSDTQGEPLAAGEGLGVRLANNILLSENPEGVAVAYASSVGFERLRSDYNLLLRMRLIDQGGGLLSQDAFARMYRLEKHSKAVLEGSIAEQFVDYKDGNFELKRDSVAVGNGLALDFVRTDHLGRDRSGKSQEDIGAYRFHEGAGRFIGARMPASPK